MRLANPNRPLSVATSLLCLLASLVGTADELESERKLKVTIGTGIDFSRGDYGDVDADGRTIETNSGSIPIFTKWEWEPITFRLAIPFVVIDGSDQVLGGTDGTEGNDTGEATSRVDYGLGDLTTSLTYTYYPSIDLDFLPIIDLTTRVKIPTAMNDLGTGKTDVTLQTEISKTFGRLSPYGGFGYRFRGGSQFEDTWLAFAGLSVRITRGFSVGASYDFREASTNSAQPVSEVSPYLSFRLSDHTRLTPYGVVGFTDGSPDWGVGTTIAYQF